MKIIKALKKLFCRKVDVYEILTSDERDELHRAVDDLVLRNQDQSHFGYKGNGFKVTRK